MASNALIADFQKAHTDLLNLVDSFVKEVESGNSGKARELLNKIKEATSSHFNFEENYLYPRLRRLVIEMTDRLRNEQEEARDFMKHAAELLYTDKLSKNKGAKILGVILRLSKLLNECNKLILLAENFREEDKLDLGKRFKESLKAQY